MTWQQLVGLNFSKCQVFRSGEEQGMIERISRDLRFHNFMADDDLGSWILLDARLSGKLLLRSSLLWVVLLVGLLDISPWRLTSIRSDDRKCSGKLSVDVVPTIRTMQAGKMAATAIGGTLLLLQIAHHKGYIKVRLTIIKWRIQNSPLYQYGHKHLNMTVIGKMKQVDWSKMTEDSATVADKIKKKLHIQSKSGLEKFQVIIVILDIIAIIIFIIVIVVDHPFLSGMECQKHLSSWWLHRRVLPWHRLVMIILTRNLQSRPLLIWMTLSADPCWILDWQLFLIDRPCLHKY